MYYIFGPRDLFWGPQNELNSHPLENEHGTSFEFTQWKRNIIFSNLHFLGSMLFFPGLIYMYMFLFANFIAELDVPLVSGDR